MEAMGIHQERISGLAELRRQAMTENALKMA